MWKGPQRSNSRLLLSVYCCRCRLSTKCAVRIWQWDSVRLRDFGTWKLAVGANSLERHQPEHWTWRRRLRQCRRLVFNRLSHWVKFKCQKANCRIQNMLISFHTRRVFLCRLATVIISLTLSLSTYLLHNSSHCRLFSPQRLTPRIHSAIVFFLGTSVFF